MIWYEVSITTTLMAEEAVTEIFNRAGSNGVVVESAEDLERIKADPTVNLIDDRILEMDPESSFIKAYFDYKTDISAVIETLAKEIEGLKSFGLNPGDVVLTYEEVEEEDWANSWKQYYKPVQIGRRLIIKPVWEEIPIEQDNIIVDIDPGMAFGTGTHETTQLCASALEATVQNGDIVYDIGCGTGILSVIAVKLGAQKAIGVDLDPVAVEVAKRNIAMNHVENRIEIHRGDLMDVLDPSVKADIVVANILADIIILLCDQVIDFIKPGGYFIASGIIEGYLDDVMDAMVQKGFEIERIESDKEWRGITACYLPKDCEEA